MPKWTKKTLFKVIILFYDFTVCVIQKQKRNTFEL